MKIEKMNGLELRDKITGFTDICTGYAVYVTGCSQVCLTPKVDEKGQTQKSNWFDVQRIEIVDVATPKVSSSPTGGPRSGSEAAPAR